MRFLIPIRITMAHGIRGGMETQAHILSHGLQRRLHDVLVFTNPHPHGIVEGIEGSVTVRYIAPGTYRRYKRAWWEACYRQLCEMHHRQPVDILLSQSAGALGYMPRAIADLHIPTVVILHGTHIGEFRTRVRSVGSLLGIYRLMRQLQTTLFLYPLWHKVVPMVDHWIAVSEQVAADAIRELPISRNRLTVVPNGIDTQRFMPNDAARAATRARYGIVPDAPVLITVGRIEQEKGIHLALDAVRHLQTRFANIQLFVVGEGRYLQHLQHQATSQHVNQHVTFTGYVANQDLPALLAAADVFLMPTLCVEGLPMNVIEAMANGLPVLASNIGGLPSAVADGITGILFPPGDTKQLIAACEQLLTDDATRLRMAAAARQRAITHFSQEHMVQHTETIALHAREHMKRHAK